MSVPYASATTGIKAREEIRKVLRCFGCEEIGFSENFEKHEVLLYFRHRGREVHLRVSAKGWAQSFSRSNHGTTTVAARNRSGSRKRLSRGMLRSTASCVTGSRAK
jgi:hypothetical protein